MIQVLAAIGCLTFAVFLFLGGASSVVFDRFIRTATRAQYDLYQRNRLFLVPRMRYETHVKIARWFMAVTGMVFSVTCLAWLVSLTLNGPK